MDKRYMTGFFFGAVIMGLIWEMCYIFLDNEFRFIIGIFSLPLVLFILLIIDMIQFGMKLNKPKNKNEK